MNASDIEIVADLPDDKPEHQHTINRSSRISTHFSLRWQSEYATHIDCQYIDNLNLWNDDFPAEIVGQLEGCSAGNSISHSFAPGEVVAEYSKARIHAVKQQQFNRGFTSQVPLEPRLGRFFPGGIFDGIPGNDSSNYQPCRIIGLDRTSITTDFNHPLATKSLAVDMRIIHVWEGGQEHGGRCNDMIDMLTSNGPGMQARYDGTATDFWSDDPFARGDESPDDMFYTSPRLVDHIDNSCSRQIGEMYRRLLPHDGRLLDLMSSWVSHLPAEFSSARITGLGMNRLELEQNPLLAETVIHDLNQNPQLPFEDGLFDGIICTASIEYLISPVEIFNELARVLKPGAPLIITFSNRWFPPKAIRIWSMVHEFERVGLVLEYFIENDSFAALHSYTLRGLPRPPDDKYADRLPMSDPVYAVWGTKT